MIIHKIASHLVKAQIEDQIANLRRLELVAFEWDLKLEREHSGYWDEAVKKAQEYYSKPQILKTPQGYKLCYGEERTLNYKGEIDGTGPFKTLREARQWFLTGGR